MTILLTAGHGKTSTRLARLLHESEHPFLLASRSLPPDSPFPTHHVHFDYLDPSTFPNPFQSAPADSPISAIYLVAPPVLDMFTPMKSFIDFARDKGVRRFVLLSASSLEAGGLMMGAVHEYLAGLGVEWCVLRPSWFMENLSELQHLAPLRDERKIYSATGSGKIPWVSADDIAAVAFRALVDEEPHNTDHVVLGPELLSYDEVAKIIGKVLDRRVTHIKLSELELSARLQSHGLPVEYATMLAKMDIAISYGSENRLNDTVLRVAGRQPRTLEDFAEANRKCWQ